jgi:D-alanyl-lipoteichoic acid acyltransferase DltB (MBOAT superfamily)
MLFNSLGFALFLSVVFILYWSVAHKKLFFQNLLLLVSSYIFYSCWDYRFLGLLIFSTLLDYFVGIKMAEAPFVKKKKFWLWLSVSINLGVLGIFKYFNFFISSFAGVLSAFGFCSNYPSLQIILPLGISFYTFHGLSYVIDIYKNKIQPEKKIVNYALYVSFFPLLIAGPIERATHLLPQIRKKRRFSYAIASIGLRQVLWGLFKKIVIADNCSEYVDWIFKYYNYYDANILLLGAILFAFQIYADFSGYSDIAIGTAKLFGIDLLQNFSFPYFSRSVGEFWRRWHISLSSWFRDYLYIPLGGSKGSVLLKIRNVFIVFLLSGLWHGANWTFIFWGVLNAGFMMPSVMFKTVRRNIGIVADVHYLPSIKEGVSIMLTFSLVVFGWVFFRAENLPHAFNYIKLLFSFSMFKISENIPWFLIYLILFFMSIEWYGRSGQFALSGIFDGKPKILRWSFYAFLLFLMGMFMHTVQTPFIYFQF